MPRSPCRIVGGRCSPALHDLYRSRSSTRSRSWTTSVLGARTGDCGRSAGTARQPAVRSACPHAARRPPRPHQAPLHVKRQRQINRLDPERAMQHHPLAPAPDDGQTDGQSPPPRVSGGYPWWFVEWLRLAELDPAADRQAAVAPARPRTKTRDHRIYRPSPLVHASWTRSDTKRTHRHMAPNVNLRAARAKSRHRVTPTLVSSSPDSIGRMDHQTTQSAPRLVHSSPGSEQAARISILVTKHPP